MLSNPQTLLRTLVDQEKKQPDKIVLALNNDIDKLRKKLRAYPHKEKRLYELLGNEAVTKEYVLDAVKKLKQERLNDERQLQLLLQTRNEATRADHIKLRLSEASGKKYMDLVTQYDWNSTLYPMPPEGVSQDDRVEQILRKRSLFESINLKVLADPKGYEFKFTLDGTIVSTTDKDELSSFEDQLEDFEERHPDISVKDMLDSKKTVEENMPFTTKVNHLKRNLATTVQTWA